MRGIVWSAIVVLVVLAAAAAAPAAPRPAKRSSSTILVKFRAPSAVKRTVARLGDRIVGTTLTGVTLVGLDRNDNLERKLAQYESLPLVRYAEPNFIGRLDMADPNDPLYSQQWGFAKVDAVDGWAVSPGSYTSASRVKIAVVDTGVQSSHTEFADGRLAAGANCVNVSDSCVAGPSEDDNGHGTHVAGVAAAATNNANGVAGLGFDASIVPVKVANGGGAATYAAMANGMVWASQHGARTLNMSISGTGYSQTLCDAVSTAINGGTLVVASAGNDGSSTLNYPAACPGAVGVAATDSNDKAASFSSYGKQNVFVSAPGVSIYSTYKGSIYKSLSGTSQAAPFVTGLAALLFAQNPSRTVADVKTLLATTSDKAGSGYGSDPYGTCSGCTWSAAYGYGRINAYKALSAGAMDFTLSVSPAALSAGVASLSTATVTVTATSGFDDAVDLSVSGAPVGVVATVSPGTVAGSGTARLTVVTAATVPGTYDLVIVGTSGSRRHELHVPLTVTLPVAVALPTLPIPLPKLPPLPGLPPLPIQP